MWTVLTMVQAEVQDDYAIVRVIADIANRGPDPEFPFQVSIPQDAFVTGLTIERDGKTFTASIQPREQARQAYEQQKNAQQTGGLVEKQRHASVYSYLINVAQATNVRASLTYERALVAEGGLYNLSLAAPVSGFGRDLGARFDIGVHATGGVAAAWGSSGASVAKEADGYRISYSVGPRPNDASTPFEVSYQLPASSDAGSLVTVVRNGTGYFAHRFHAPPDARTMSEDLVLVLDVSGSMAGQKFQQLQDAATQVIQTLRGDDRLHIIFFSSDANAAWPGLRPMTPANRTDAARVIAQALVAGGTNLEAGIRTGFSVLDSVDWTAEEGRLPVLAFLTDGQPTVGQTDRATLRSLAKSANAHGVNVFAIALGEDADWGFIHAIAEDGRGAALRVPEGAGAEVDLRRFLSGLTTPVLKDVRVGYGPGVVAYRTTAPILFAGSEVLVVGTFDPALGLGNVTVTARAADGERVFHVAPQPAAGNVSFLPRLVAYERIRQLEDSISAAGASPALANESTKLALEHGFVTDRTSLVVTLAPRELRAQSAGDPTQGNASMVVYDSAPIPRSADAWRVSPASSVTPVPTATTTTTESRSAFRAPQDVTPTAKVPAVGAAGVILGAAVALVLLLALRRK